MAEVDIEKDTIGETATSAPESPVDRLAESRANRGKICIGFPKGSCDKIPDAKESRGFYCVDCYAKRPKAEPKRKTSGPESQASIRVKPDAISQPKEPKKKSRADREAKYIKTIVEEANPLILQGMSATGIPAQMLYTDPGAKEPTPFGQAAIFSPLEAKILGMSASYVEDLPFFQTLGKSSAVPMGIALGIAGVGVVAFKAFTCWKLHGILTDPEKLQAFLQEAMAKAQSQAAPAPAPTPTHPTDPATNGHVAEAVIPVA